MDPMDMLVESQIREAQEAGCFDNLPGMGKPLDLSEPDGVPKELRSAYRLLKNAGVLPEELELHQRRATLGQLLRACAESDPERAELEKEYRSVSLRYQLLRERRGFCAADSEYADKVLRRLS